MYRIIFISGATASGKSDFIHALIDKYFPNASILSVDSMQVYKMLCIGTAKPKEEIKNKYNYNIIDCIDPKLNFTVSDYLDICASVIPKMSNPIFAVGGSGLYSSALKYGLFKESDDNGIVRKKLYDDYEQHGHSYMVDILKNIDIDSYNTIDIQNIRRVIRAIEVYYKTGKIFSEMKNERQPIIPIKYVDYAIDKDRNILYDDINARVINMFENGLLEEVRSIIDYGVDIKNTSMQGIGYKECYEYLVNKTISYDRLIYNVQINTRHFAKRQLTWFRREKPNWTNVNDNSAIENMVMEVKAFCNIMN